MTRGSIGLHERLVKITCHIWGREASKSSLGVPSCQQTFLFQLQRTRDSLRLWHCICVTLRESWSRLSSTTSRLNRNHTSLALTKARHRCTHSLCTIYRSIYFRRLNLPPHRFSNKLFLLASLWNNYQLHSISLPTAIYGTDTFLKL